MQKSRSSKTLIVQLLHWPAISKDDTASLGKAGIKFMSAHAFLAFLGQLGFWMGTIWVARWNRLEILIPKPMWKSKIWLLEQIWDQNPYDTFFLGHPVHQPIYINIQRLCWALEHKKWRLDLQGRVYIVRNQLVMTEQYLKEQFMGHDMYCWVRVRLWLFEGDRG